MKKAWQGHHFVHIGGLQKESLERTSMKFVEQHMRNKVAFSAEQGEKSRCFLEARRLARELWKPEGCFFRR